MPTLIKLYELCMQKELRPHWSRGFDLFSLRLFENQNLRSRPCLGHTQRAPLDLEKQNVWLIPCGASWEAVAAIHGWARHMSRKADPTLGRRCSGVTLEIMESAGSSSPDQTWRRSFENALVKMCGTGWRAAARDSREKLAEPKASVHQRSCTPLGWAKVGQTKREDHTTGSGCQRGPFLTQRLRLADHGMVHVLNFESFLNLNFELVYCVCIRCYSDCELQGRKINFTNSKTLVLRPIVTRVTFDLPECEELK